MSNTFEVNLTIDLDRWLRGDPGNYDSDGIPGDFAPTTLEELVLDRVVEKLAADVLAGPFGKSLNQRIQGVRDEVIREHVEPAITGAMTAPDGDSMRDYIAARVNETLLTPTADPGAGYSAPRRTMVERYIEKEVNHAVRRDLAAALEEGKTQVKNALREMGAEILADVLAKQAEGK